VTEPNAVCEDSDCFALACTKCPAIVLMPVEQMRADITRAKGWAFSILGGWRCPACSTAGDSTAAPE
jgi:hypothetical protein